MPAPCLALTDWPPSLSPGTHPDWPPRAATCICSGLAAVGREGPFLSEGMARGLADTPEMPGSTQGWDWALGRDHIT